MFAERSGCEIEKNGDVPGTDVPDPSLGGVPRAEGPATHRLGASRPVDRAPGCRPAPTGMTGGSDDPGRPGDGPVAVRTLLASDPPRPPAGDVQDPEGVAFTAVSPFY